LATTSEMLKGIASYQCEFNFLKTLNKRSIGLLIIANRLAA